MQRLKGRTAYAVRVSAPACADTSGRRPTSPSPAEAHRCRSSSNTSTAKPDRFERQAPPGDRTGLANPGLKPRACAQETPVRGTSLLERRAWYRPLPPSTRRRGGDHNDTPHAGSLRDRPPRLPGNASVSSVDLVGQSVQLGRPIRTAKVGACPRRRTSGEPAAGAPAQATRTTARATRRWMVS